MGLNVTNTLQVSHSPPDSSQLSHVVMDTLWSQHFKDKCSEYLPVHLTIQGWQLFRPCLLETDISDKGIASRAQRSGG